MVEHILRLRSDMAITSAFLLPSLAPAVAGSAIYGIFMAVFIWRAYATHMFTPYVFATIFSTLRTIGFACRAAWSQQLAEGIIPLVYVTTIFQYIPFIFEIFVVVTLSINWVFASIRQGSRPPAIEIRGIKAFRILVITAQLLTISGAVTFLVAAGTGRSDLLATGATVKNVAFCLFFICVVIALAVVNVYYLLNTSIARFSDYLLLLVFYILLLVKLGFHVGAVNKPATAAMNAEEVYYYCLDVLPEFLICLIAVVINLSRVKNGMEPWSPKQENSLEMKDVV
ncbi:hypothetical protein BGW37DRAFT_484955 [Umbelopsis sp. PMI_123]|nr:hypothetical protein BGW37DRAFT_484955 [Umbelopsis sp. PMI_123]